MLTKYKDRSGSLVFNIIVAIIGIVLIFKPALGVAFVRLYVGILLLLGALFCFYSYKKNPSKPKGKIFETAFLGILGLAFLFSGGFSDTAFGIVLMLWMFADGFLKVGLALAYKKVDAMYWWILALFGSVSIVLGIYIVTDLGRGVESIIVIGGLFMLANAVGSIFDSLFYKRQLK